ncbi:uncharacterized protein LOC134456840 [Engraulis encrasicolus]|uniref:uncharacterized protein LOC134456840 n=1 Tax=Engraulis encrasicolus TaxID=184585 RepID=UPI002FD5C379
MSSNNSASASAKSPLLRAQIAPASPKITLTRSTSPPPPSALRVTPPRAATPISSSSPPPSSSTTTSPLLHSSSSSSSCSSSSSPLVRRRPVHILSSPPAGLLHVPRVTRSQPSSPTNTPRCNMPIKSSPSSSPTSVSQSNACNKDSPSSPSPNQMERISPALEVWSETFPAEGQSLRLSPTPSSERKVRSISISNSTPERGSTPEHGSTPERCSTPELGRDNGGHGDVRTVDSAPLNHGTAGAKFNSAIATRPSHNTNVKAASLSSSSSSSSSSAASWSKDRKRPSSTVEVVKGSRPGGQIKRRYQDPVLLQARLRLTKTGKGPDLSPRLLGRGGGHEGGEDQAAKRAARDNVSVEREQSQTALLAALSPPTSTNSSTPPPSMTPRTHSMSAAPPRASGGTTTTVAANRHTLRQPRSVPGSPSMECRNNKGDPTSNMGQLREARSSCLPCRTPRLQRRGLGTEPSSHRGAASPNTNNVPIPPAETSTASPESSTLKSDRKEMEQGRWGVMAPTRGNVTMSPAETVQSAEASMAPPPESSPLKSDRSSQEEEKEEEVEAGGAQLGRCSPAAARQIKEVETRADSGDSDNDGSVHHRYEKKEGAHFPKGTRFSQLSPDHCALAAEAVTVCEVVRVVGATLVERGRADSCRSPPPPQRPLPASPSPSPSHNIATLAKREGEGEGVSPTSDRPRVSTLGAGEGHREGNARECTGNERREQQLMSAHCYPHSCQLPQQTPHPQKHQPNHLQYQPQYHQQQHPLHHHQYQQQHNKHQHLLQHNIQPDHHHHLHQQHQDPHQDQGLPPRPRNRPHPLARQAAQLGLGLGLALEGSDGCSSDSYSHRQQRILDTAGMDWCPMDRLEEEEDPPLPEPSASLGRMRAPLRQQGARMGSGVWVTLGE